ncbi:DeoR/GlpR family DNA-binding transcription regulator [Aerococcaceae bacterium NML191292]|nr:DeoR/GlpR family DNA-binding transcription regulator [Aerococcaceae bacterium NML191292]MCW6662631.1 DeoR/GlpR family DNA-binding transcription regulator [Aerococcaceae bacterium NML190073]MCW6676187.1 DeoR/GlpR family DNA-binding transcription regulator [Aerococcaceae bacterium NML180378]
MASFERKKKIIDILQRRKVISTKELEALTFCSTSTLRRDLIELEKEGIIIRSHGEVRIVAANNIEYAYSARQTLEINAKQKIATLAADFFTHNQSIFMDSSTTAACLIPYLEHLNALRVITNGIEAAIKLNSLDNVTLFMAGGYIANGTNSVLGDFSTSFLDNFHADIAVFSCRGLDRYGAYEANHEQAIIKQHMIRNSDKVILLADHTKFNTSHYFKLMNYSAIDHLITDKSPSCAFLDIVGEQCEILW